MLPTLHFRQFSDISSALLCIVVRNRNNRRLLAFIDQYLKMALVLRTERSGVRQIGADDLDARSAPRRGDERSEESISPGAPIKTKGYIFSGVTLCSLGSSMGSNSREITCDIGR